MKQTEAQLRASKKYRQKFADLRIRVPHDVKANIDAHTCKTGESINAFVRRAIFEAMARDQSKEPVAEAPGYLFRRISGGDALVHSFVELSTKDSVELCLEANSIKRVRETGKPGCGIYDPYLDAVFSVMLPGADDFILLASLDDDQLNDLIAACEGCKVGEHRTGAAVMEFANQYGNVHIVANGPVKMRFDTPEQMLEFINAGHDLYSEKAEVYVFSYNEAGSICTYNLDPKEAADLAQEANDVGEYWGALLGPGGQIWDDPSHECYREGQATNLDCCASLIQYNDWVLCSRGEDVKSPSVISA